MLDEIRGAALSSARRVDRRAPAWLRRRVRSLPWPHQAARSTRTRALWEEEYRSGRWDRLHTLNEFGRHSIIAGYVRQMGSGQRLLDVGCGNGALKDQLPDLGNVYVGCDLALPALRAAARPGRSPELLLVADAERLPFQPASFDLVICNEVLNYLSDVPAAVGGLVGTLRVGGHLIVSLFDAFGAPQTALWKSITEACEVVDMVALTRMSTSVTWRIALLAPRRPEALQDPGWR